MNIPILHHARALSLLGVALFLCACATDSTPEPLPAEDAGVDARTDAASTADAALPFTLTSSEFQDQGTLSAEHTCDGAGSSPPLSWAGVPAGTAELALLMTTVAKDGLKWNWVLYHLPASTTSLAVGAMGVGTAGLTSDGPALAYSPPCSKGPGAMSYTFTLHALPAAPTFSVPASQITGQVVTDAVDKLVIASSQLTVSYTRPIAP